MKLKELYVCHLLEPIGYLIEKLVFSWKVSDSVSKKQAWARIEVSKDSEWKELVWDTGKSADLKSTGTQAEFELEPCTRYFWRVTVEGDAKDQAEAESFFETGKMNLPWEAKWICAEEKSKIHPYFQKEFYLSEEIISARMYMTGLGLYEARINGEEVSDEHFAPFFNDYDLWVQYQTYDVTALLHKGPNTIDVTLGRGWYHGRVGFDGGAEFLYGDTLKMMAELHVELASGEKLVIVSDESWKWTESPVTESGIYDGETYDARILIPQWSEMKAVQLTSAPKGKITDRLSPPVKVIEHWDKVTVLHTPKEERVLDFGQVMTGWVEFDCSLPEGRKITLSYGELLQDDCFYQENLRTAEQKFTYISNGRPEHVRAHFTYFGFRYVKVEGIEEAELSKFTASIIHSDLPEIGTIVTSNEKVNRLFANARWSQRGNFLDLPTDCPQRDERYGWTGDAQVFCATASFNRYTPAFYRKYLYDMLLEQKKHDGNVPHVVPDIINSVCDALEIESDGNCGSCAWSDAAVIIPWTLYTFYGDEYLLRENYENMRMWADYLISEDEEHGSSNLRLCGFHFGDWLALDNPEDDSGFGATDPFYIASAYYYWSVLHTGKAAEVLGIKEDKEKYAAKAAIIKAAIQGKYFQGDEPESAKTQTGMSLALAMGLVPEAMYEEIVGKLKQKLEDNKIALDTGFVGTYFLCSSLAQNGLIDYAYELLFREEMPSWLYEVNMGATTIWERWNSVLPDGRVSDTGMNSMNHYSYGSIAEWMYRFMCGMNVKEDYPGCHMMEIHPMPTKKLEYAYGTYDSAYGRYCSGWRRTEDGMEYEIEVPFNAVAVFYLDEHPKQVWINGEVCIELKEGQKISLMTGKYFIRTN